MHQQRTGGIKEVWFPANLDMIEGTDQIHHASGIDIQPEPPQDTTEEQQIVQELSAQSTPALIRSRIKRACAPFTFSTSS